ncbi:SDR family NAD(P)-dependent oxidoreductase [Temperatibacter marinus]|uniref:SDR family NAD(P)-dependent oxidoreductase n=1 Tax=Temperatibacter marinus TaxID=1456591 RepID=A0AA52EJF3_9PROT|nr:SDR family NAD(P)-dependent oxidoreductase [Temperatibacter marinus]WND03146.1 SDR family NAD(P)-dependent oxidoreductase [Temperatibacter marinus]
MKLADIGVVVTGGASGLGGATAEYFAAQGAKVTIFDLNEEAGHKQAEKIGGQFAKVNVADEASVRSGLDLAETAHGITRVLMNCAGIIGAGKTVGRDGAMPLDKYKAAIDVNLVGSFNCIRLVAERLCKADPIDGERGILISTASIAGYEGQIGQVAYAASKGGIIGMTLPVARDLSRDLIRNMTIAPGIFMTPMLAAVPDEYRQALAANVPNPSRLGDPEEFARLAEHIVENQYLNGEVIRLDGALRMQPK